MMEDIKSLIQNSNQPSTISILWIQKFYQEYKQSQMVEQRKKPTKRTIFYSNINERERY
jgi:hypothetical protein